jgi:hypothetical protein
LEFAKAEMLQAKEVSPPSTADHPHPTEEPLSPVIRLIPAKLRRCPSSSFLSQFAAGDAGFSLPFVLAVLWELRRQVSDAQQLQEHQNSSPGRDRQFPDPVRKGSVALKAVRARIANV